MFKMVSELGTGRLEVQLRRGHLMVQESRGGERESGPKYRCGSAWDWKDPLSL